MSVIKDPSGRRSIQVEVEVPGTPEQVWEAIATGPGVTSWFLPAEFRDGDVVTTFGPGMEARAHVTAWEPPHRFVAEGEEMAPGGPTIATEWVVEANAGGTCTVRVVHSLFATTDDWDEQLQSFEGGWPWFFRILRLYLTHFRSQPSASFRAMAFPKAPIGEVWRTVAEGLGLQHLQEGERVRAHGGDVAMAGAVVTEQGKENTHGTMLLLDEPAPGIGSIFGHELSDKTWFVIDAYFYGVDAKEIAAEVGPKWQAWLNRTFPPPPAETE
jgi:uncharacterized protein YndB with AHSA1/START domain